MTGDNLSALTEFVAEQTANIAQFDNVSADDKAAVLQLFEKLINVANGVNEVKLTQPALINACAVDFLDAFGYSVYGYFWLAMSNAAHDHEDSRFKQQKQHLSRFYFDKLLAKADYHLSQVAAGDAAIMEIDESLF